MQACREAQEGLMRSIIVLYVQPGILHFFALELKSMVVKVSRTVKYFVPALHIFAQRVASFENIFWGACPAHTCNIGMPLADFCSAHWSQSRPRILRRRS